MERAERVERAEPAEQADQAERALIASADRRSRERARPFPETARARPGASADRRRTDPR